ncbi:MAG TPA: heavy-metal-associated domain-containing protein, partial [Chromatiaceae bacterium]|nr:heavy-metal-associated domain-containing protein [Chromatiaceae bacterium]
MTHTYQLTGMSCNGCKANAEAALNNLVEVQTAIANLEKKEVVIEMATHVSIEKLQDTLVNAGLHYTITDKACHQHSNIAEQQHNKKPLQDGNGIFYCPMQCEGEKTYDKAVGCPVCGMDLVEQPRLQQSVQYTCPMHPEIIEGGPGDCQVCGMDLVPKEPAENEENKIYQGLLKKMKIAVLFTLPVFIIAMADIIPGKPLSTVF